jgi:hypothetical protein
LSRTPLRLVLNRPGCTRPRRRAVAPPTPTAGRDQVDARTRDRVMLGIAVFALLLIVSSVWVMERLLEAGKIQDCVWQGRKNCAPISAPPR